MNTVGYQQSGAGRVLPSLAGWEEISPVKGVFSHEAYRCSSRIARRAGARRGRTIQVVDVTDAALAQPDF
jgi:hypothetical protein